MFASGGKSSQENKLELKLHLCSIQASVLGLQIEGAACISDSVGRADRLFGGHFFEEFTLYHKQQEYGSKT